MTPVVALVLLAGLAVAALVAGRRRRATPCHLLTVRQLADEVGVSVAAVAAWQAEGLIPTVHCGGCAGTIPFDVVARLRCLAVAPAVPTYRPSAGADAAGMAGGAAEADRPTNDGAGLHPDAVPTAR